MQVVLRTPNPRRKLNLFQVEDKNHLKLFIYVWHSIKIITRYIRIKGPNY